MTDWQKDAVCATVDPELFFPEPWAHEQRAAAKAICATCPVKLDCLQHALDTRDRYAILGGLTSIEREALRGTAKGRTRNVCTNGHPYPPNQKLTGVRRVCQVCKEARRLARAS